MDTRDIKSKQSTAVYANAHLKCTILGIPYFIMPRLYDNIPILPQKAHGKVSCLVDLRCVMSSGHPKTEFIFFSISLNI